MVSDSFLARIVFYLGVRPPSPTQTRKGGLQCKECVGKWSREAPKGEGAKEKKPTKFVRKKPASVHHGGQLAPRPSGKRWESVQNTPEPSRPRDRRAAVYS